jgi:glutaredoxin domain-containing cysteine-rich protein 1
MGSNTSKSSSLTTLQVDRERGPFRSLSVSNYRTPPPPKKADLQYNPHTVALTSASISTGGFMKLVESPDNTAAARGLASVITTGAAGRSDRPAAPLYKSVKKWDSMPPRMDALLYQSSALSNSWADLGVVRNSILCEHEKDDRIKPLIKQQQQQISKADVKDQEIEIIDAWELMKGLEVEDRSNPSSTSPLLLLPDSHASTFLANEAIDMDEKMVQCYKSLDQKSRSHSMSTHGFDAGAPASSTLKQMLGNAVHVLNSSYSVHQDRTNGTNRLIVEHDFTEVCAPQGSGRNLKAADCLQEAHGNDDMDLFDPDILADFADSLEHDSDASDGWCHVGSDGEVTSCSTSTLDDDSPKFHWMESDNLQQHSSHRTFYEQQQESTTETTNSEMQKSVSLLTMRCTKKKTSSCEEVSPIDVEEQKDLDPLSRYELKCPPGGQDRVVLYTTSLRGIRKTFESCNTLRMILESFNVYVDERDVSMHAGFREELKALFGKPVPVPRVFIKGHYIGGAEEVFELHEDGLLIDLVKTLPVRISRQVCDCCGGIRFVPCTECNGSCKILTDTYDVKRCPNCNENGLIRCTLCS